MKMVGEVPLLYAPQETGSRLERQMLNTMAEFVKANEVTAGRQSGGRTRQAANKPADRCDDQNDGRNGRR